MKKLSRDERIGAIMLGIVSLLSIGGGMCVRHVSSDSSYLPPEVEIITVSDSVYLSNDESEAADEKKAARRGKNKACSHKSHKKKSGNKRGDSRKPESAITVGESRWRDLLADTVPVSPHRNQ